MQLEGIHHITAITGDAPGNVAFYVGVLGLRMVKKTVNQDDPTIYHLFYADEKGSAGADLTFFEYPGASPGRPGAGMVHRVVWRVGSEEGLDFWGDRLAGEGVQTQRDGRSLRFADPEGLDLELVVSDARDEPLAASAPDVPDELALQGFEAVRAYSADPRASERLLGDALGFRRDDGDHWEVRGAQRGGHYIYDPAPPEPGHQSAGTVHHVAFAARMEEHAAWRNRALEGGARPTPVIDRFYFRSIYFREPSGVLFEIASLGPGFAVDEPAEELGRHLSLPPDYERLRPQLERTLTPLPDPRAERAGAARG
jgi:glyoxalase family protein